MLVETTKKPAKPRRTLPRRRIGLVISAGVLLTLVGLTVPLAMYSGNYRALLDEIGNAWPGLKEMAGLGAFSGKGQILKAYARNPSRLLGRMADLPKSYFGGSELPTLTLDIKFKHLRKLHRKRDAALKRGYLITGSADFVPANLRFGDKSYRVKLRLKGDLPDHYNSEKWSFRVQMKGNAQILGMRRFSLQAPKTRQYQAQSLYLDFMRSFGILAPRYRFVNLWVNGTDIGIMAMEEHFSKELAESQKRRDSVILAFDESLAWERWGEWEGGRPGANFFKDYTNARIKAFRYGRIKTSKALNANYRLAVGMLRGVVDGTFAPSQAFDVARLGRYLAIAQLWSARHDINWGNIRFYFNPISARLEPVAYDAKFEYWEKGEWLIEAPRPLALHLLSDPAVFESYYKSLKQISGQMLDGGLLTDLARREKAEWLTLAAEFPLLEHLPIEKLKRRAQWLNGMSVAELRLAKDNPEAVKEALPKIARPLLPPYSQLVHAYRFVDGGKNVIEVRNAMPKAVEIRSIYWETTDGIQEIPVKAKTTVPYPLQLPPKVLDVVAKPVLIAFDTPAVKQPLRLMVEARLADGGDSVRSEALPSAPVLNVRPTPEASLAETLARHRFIRWDADARQLVATKGDWLVTGDLIVPKGVELTVPAGTRLRFEKDRALIAYGPLSLQGSKDAPVVLEGVSGKWQGVAVLEAGKKSHWAHVNIRGTTSVQRGDWSLTGGVTFFASPVEMAFVSLDGHSGEDALNIVSTEFLLRNVDIAHTASDAFDSDFSTGRVIGGVYRDIGGNSGGDGIDVSGTTISIEGVHFDGVSDKALSIGEGSRAEARDVWIRNASTGAASKDGSHLTLTGSRIENARVAGLMAYQKKPVYGGGRVEASDVTITGSAPAALAQDGSHIVLNKRTVVAKALDVDKLYKTVMKKAVTQ